MVSPAYGKQESSARRWEPQADFSYALMTRANASNKTRNAKKSYLDISIPPFVKLTPGRMDHLPFR